MFGSFMKMRWFHLERLKGLLAMTYRRSKEVTLTLWGVLLFELAFLSKFLKAFTEELHPDLASPPDTESTLERVSSTETIVERCESSSSTSEESVSNTNQETVSPNSS